MKVLRLVSCISDLGIHNLVNQNINLYNHPGSNRYAFNAMEYNYLYLYFIFTIIVICYTILL